MATVNFSVPDEVKARFNRTFKGRNKSAVLSRLMEQAVRQEELHKRRVKVIDALLALRSKSSSTKPAVTDAGIRKARQRSRP